MRLSVFGLGYVGTVSGVCLARDGHQVVGVDKNPAKVEPLAEGHLPIVEPGMSAILRQTVSDKSFTCVTDPEAAIANSDLSLIAVGTYASADGSADLHAIFQVADEIGRALSKKRGHHAVVVRSTVPPGTTELVLKRVAAASGRRLGVTLGGGMNPEFLREGSALHDFYHPPFVVAGTGDAQTERMLRELYASVEAPFVATEIRLAEILKYSCNAFHALKVSFANEIGRICSSAGIDGLALMDVFVRDTILNVSPRYLKPGIPFGGSCLPKDLSGLVGFARSKGVQVPLLEGVRSSNEAHFAEVLRVIDEKDPGTVAVLGLTFKEDTDDLRESPVVRLLRALIDRGREVKWYDANLVDRELFGTNLELVSRLFPEFEKTRVGTLDELIVGPDLLVVTNGQYSRDQHFRSLIATGSVPVIDLHGGYRPEKSAEWYHGLCW